MRIIEYRGDNIEGVSGAGIKLAFNVRTEFGISEEPPMVIVSPEVTCALLDQPDREVCFLKMQMIFRVQGLESYDIKSEMKLPEAFMGNIVNLSVGAMRGVLFAKNQGMSYANVIIPPLDVQELLPKGPFRPTDEVMEISA